MCWRAAKRRVVNVVAAFVTVVDFVHTIVINTLLGFAIMKQYF